MTPARDIRPLGCAQLQTRGAGYSAAAMAEYSIVLSLSSFINLLCIGIVRHQHNVHYHCLDSIQCTYFVL